MKACPPGTFVRFDNHIAEVIGYSSHKDEYMLSAFNQLRTMYTVSRDATDLDFLKVKDEVFIDFESGPCIVDKIEDKCVHLIQVNTGKTIILHSCIPYKGELNPNELKQSNPKDSIGMEKIPMSVLSGPVIYEVGLGMAEGALKYGKHNYREIGVRFSVYFDAAMRHMWAVQEGEDIDPDSGLPHIVKAMSSLHVLRDAQIRGKCYDDRPRGTKGFIAKLNQIWKKILGKYPNPVPPYLANGNPPDEYNFGDYLI